jgi:hypothetical protein
MRSLDGLSSIWRAIAWMATSVASAMVNIDGGSDDGRVDVTKFFFNFWIVLRRQRPRPTSQQLQAY